MGKICTTLLFAFLLIAVSHSSGAQTSGQAPGLTVRPAEVKPQGVPKHPNQNAYYQQLRQLLPAGDAYAVSEFALVRDAAKFTFHSGTFTFYGEVDGKVTGAVFHGSGTIHMVPPTEEEKHSLALLTKSPGMDEEFSTAVFRFTDETAAEIHKASSGAKGKDASATSSGQALAIAMQTQVHYNVDARLLEDVLSPAPGEFFMAWIDGKKFSSKMLFTFDPRGAWRVEPEEVKLETWNETKQGVWAAFHRAADFTVGRPSGNEDNASFTIDHQDLDTTIAKNGKLDGLAKTTIRAQKDGLVVIPMALFPTLRAAAAMGPDGIQLDYVQEDKERDPNFAVILPTPLKRGQDYVLTVSYSGKDVVEDEGNANYYLNGGARESWYPNLTSGGLGGYATYTMTFRVPKGLDIVATGERTLEQAEGGQTITQWKSDVPIAVAGFNLGRFETETVTLNSDFRLTAYANTDLPNSAAGLAGGPAMGTMATPILLKQQIAEGEAALQIYGTNFGPLPYKHLALTQQTACNYGQSWPMLVYLPICGFWDSTVRHQLGLDRSDPSYWNVVTAHEVAHQWWGQTVGFRSYRDQWMSEGFANFSASMFLQGTRKNDKEYREFWKHERELIVERNAEGYRPIDVGPVTMGYRLANSRAGESVYTSLVYPKGAYILHMVRMMMWNSHEHDSVLNAALRDFLTMNRNRAATTEDFKAALERHLPHSLDLDHNGKLDWFFDEFVYGTALPSYGIMADIKPNEKGTLVHLKLIQGNVDASFRMFVPIYIELNDGNVLRVAQAAMMGSSSFEQDLQIPPLRSPVKKVTVNYYDDVLSTMQ